MTEHSRLVETRGLFGDRAQSSQEEIRDLAGQSTLRMMFARIERMRVVPLDLRPHRQLFGSTLGAMATLLPLLNTRGEAAAILEAIGKLPGQIRAVRIEQIPPCGSGAHRAAGSARDRRDRAGRIGLDFDA